MPTALELEIVIHYKDYDTKNGPWDSNRVRRLCRMLLITERELARYIRIRPSALGAYNKLGKYPGPVLLLLDLIERSQDNKVLGTVHKYPLFPLIDNG